MDGSLEDFFFSKIHNDDRSNSLNMKINWEYDLFCKALGLTKDCEWFPD